MSTSSSGAGFELSNEELASPTGTIPDGCSARYKERVKAHEKYKIKSSKLIQEVDELLLHLDRIDCVETEAVVKELRDTTFWISELNTALEYEFPCKDESEESSIIDIYISMRNLEYEYTALLGTLYRQKHAFRSLQRAIKGLQEAQNDIDTMGGNLDVFEKIVPNLSHLFAKLAKEFHTFSDKSFPAFVDEEEERDTTRYLALSTIATFFSSITATTLQFTYQETSGGLDKATNLFWFISLVFSVSSGVNSLLTIMWRKSRVYSEKRNAPSVIKLWFRKTPIVFMGISAVAFIIGLNLFAYSSHQPTSVATTLSAFTAFHTLGLLIVTTWFIVQLSWRHLYFHVLRRKICLGLHLYKGVYSSNMEIAILKDWPITPPLQTDDSSVKEEAGQDERKFDYLGFEDRNLETKAIAFLHSVDQKIPLPAKTATQPDATPQPKSDLQPRPSRRPTPHRRGSSRLRPLPRRSTARAASSATSLAASELFYWYFQQWNKQLFEVESIETAGNLLLWGMDDLKVSFKIVADGMREVDRRRGRRKTEPEEPRPGGETSSPSSRSGLRPHFNEASMPVDQAGTVNAV